MEDKNIEASTVDQEPAKALLFFLDVLKRHLKRIVVFALIVAVVSAGLSLLMKNKYKAEATLAVLPPTYRTEFMPEPFTMPTLHSMLRSTAIVKEVRDELKLDVEIEELSKDLSASLSMERYGTMTDYSTVYRLTAIAESPDLASELVNRWAEICIERLNSLFKTTKDKNVGFLVEEHERFEDDLKTRRQVLKGARTSYKATTKKAEDTWDRTITDFKKEWNLERMAADLEELNTGIAEIHTDWISTKYEAKAAEQKLAALEAKLGETPRTETVLRTITDDALWSAISDRLSNAQQSDDASSSIISDLSEIKLRTEVLNPVYSDLAALVAEADAGAKMLREKAERMKAEMDEAITEANASSAEYHERSYELAELERDRALELAEIAHEEEREIQQLESEINAHSVVFEDITQKADMAGIAKKEEADFVKLAAKGVPPDRKIGPNRKVFAGVCTLSFTAIFVLWLVLSEILTLYLKKEISST